MPQDGRKSARYRPFVTCDDPKGVVECGTIRKSKLSSYQIMEPRKTDTQTGLKNPNKTLASVTEERDYQRDDDFRGLASLQVSDVSKGAQKLNHMIEAWSKNLTIEGQPRDIAKDLLKGALDLQESLMMLGKLQAASKYVTKLKKKQQEKAGNNNGGQEDRVSKEKIVELKEIIRSSFERQNLFRVGNGGKAHFDQFDQEPNIPSTSSSHSSSSYNEKIDEKLEKGMAKGPGIIARLMGLEEMSSKPLFHKDMQMPKLKDRICEDSNGDKKKKTLKEVIDTMYLKGLLKENSVTTNRVSRDYDMMPPIVLIKPLPIPPRPENDAIAEVKDVEFSEDMESTNGRRSIICKEKVEKVKPFTPSKRRPLRREVSNKKPCENEKANKSERKSLEKGTPQIRVKEIVKPESRSNVVVVAKRGHDSSKKGRQTVVKKEEPLKQRKELKPKELKTHRTQTDQKKIRKNDKKTVNELKEAKLTKGTVVSQQEDEIKIDSSSKIDISVNTNSVHIDLQAIEVIQDASESQISDIDGYGTCIPVKGYDCGNRRSLLLSSQSFLNCAEDLFSFISSSPANPEKTDSQQPNHRLYIDCATELIERKSLHALETECLVQPWPLRSSTKCISMEKLVEEVCDGIEILSSYWSCGSDSCPEDGLYAVLKRDLNENRGMVGSKLWDMGWNRGFCSDDVGKVAIEMEGMILSCLIEELFGGRPDVR